MGGSTLRHYEVPFGCPCSLSGAQSPTPFINLPRTAWSVCAILTNNSLREVVGRLVVLLDYNDRSYIRLQHRRSGSYQLIPFLGVPTLVTANPTYRQELKTQVHWLRGVVFPSQRLLIQDRDQ